MARQIPPDRLSHLIGLVYDCVIEPKRWEATLHAIGIELDFCHSILGLYANPGVPKLLVTTGIEPYWVERFPALVPSSAALWGGPARLACYPLDEPVAASQAVPADVYAGNSFQTDWLRPQGVVDLVAIAIARSPTHLGSVGFGRHEQAGAATERELAALRLLGPHFRRAIEISDLLDIKTIEASTLASTLDTLKAGIVLVDEDVRPVHANEAAQAMLDAGDPIRTDRGRIMLPSDPASAALADSVARAALDEMRLGQRGIGIPARRRDGSAAVAHVLPLKRGEIRPGLESRATAAVFIAPAAVAPQMPADALALLYDLTPAETRVLVLIAEGASPAAIAERLGVALSTVKNASSVPTLWVLDTIRL